MFGSKLHEYIEEGKHIYVRNLSGDHPDDITKLIILEIKPINGPPRTVKIPPVDVPINLSAMVSPPQILGESQDLLDYINNEVLELVDPEEAQEELRDPRAQRIVQKAMRDIHSRSAYDPRRKSSMKRGHGPRKVPKPMTNEDTDLSGGKNPLQQLLANAADDTASVPEVKLSKASQEVNPTIMEMCATLVADPGMADSILEDLDIIPDGDISDADLGHVIKRAGVKKVVDWAQERLAARGLEEEEEEETAPTRRKRGKRKKRR